MVYVCTNRRAFANSLGGLTRGFIRVLVHCHRAEEITVDTLGRLHSVPPSRIHMTRYRGIVSPGRPRRVSTCRP